MTTVQKNLPPDTMLHEYRIDRVLGVGAFGITYQGLDTNLNIAVAIKEYFPAELVERDGAKVKLKSAADEELYRFGLDAFVSEARILARLKDPNIVRISRYFNANGTAYFVMDYEEGATLAELLQREDGRRIGEARLRELLLPLLKGLRTIHAKQYLHRDIKPGNIYLRKDGSPLLIDFGAAKLEFGSAGAQGFCALTPGYAPLEQYDEFGDQGPWSDLYALGATIYRCMTGNTPVAAASRHSALRMGMEDPLMPAVHAAGSDYSPAFLQVIDWMLALKPADRAPSAGKVLERLQSDGGSGGEPTTTTAFLYKPRQCVRNHKILFVGPVGAGKSTAIATLSDTGTVSTDQAASDMTRARKSQTTVAMDYGIMNVSETERIHLYGAPGQERFDFMWSILQQGVLGLVILVDNSRKAPFDDLAFYLKWFDELIGRTKVVIGVNFAAAGPGPDLESYHRFLLDEKFAPRINPPIFEVDARDKTDMATLIQALLVSLDPGVPDYDI